MSLVSTPLSLSLSILASRKCFHYHRVYGCASALLLEIAHLPPLLYGDTVEVRNSTRGNYYLFKIDTRVVRAAERGTFRDTAVTESIENGGVYRGKRENQKESNKTKRPEQDEMRNAMSEWE